jgi:hypothetical protein
MAELNRRLGVAAHHTFDTAIKPLRTQMAARTHGTFTFEAFSLAVRTVFSELDSQS